MNDQHFRISTHLKDIIGRDLVTNPFVALYELVKNAFDAKASRVDVVIDTIHSTIWVVDDGKGMDADAIRDRWLFVAYSAKADGTEDSTATSDYRDRIRPTAQYAGSKGIGRFSCDTLGESLVLYSRSSRDLPTQRLHVRWQDFEINRKQLFDQIAVGLEAVEGFPADVPVSTPSRSGTVLQIQGLRSQWALVEIQRLRRHLEKLIDPFGTTHNTPVHISVIDSTVDKVQLDAVQGPIGNDLRDLLSGKTTRIVVTIEDEQIRTELVDRGRPIYRIVEGSPYRGLDGASIKAEIFYLNQSAKNTFTRRMSVRPVEFGSVFLFVNGFRIFPIGEETDDTFGLNRRKQQGASRYFGTRDVMGRVDVTARHGMFREASSRDAGLIQDARVHDLYDAIRSRAIFRLERYVVGVTWRDKADQLREDSSGLSITATRGRVVDIVGKLAATTNLELEYYDPHIVEVFEGGARSFDRTMKSLAAIAERQGDMQLLRRVETARARQVELAQSEKEATEAAQRAMTEKERADEHIARLEQQTTYLASTQDMTVEQMTLLVHQVLIYSGHIGAAIDRALGSATEVAEAVSEIGSVNVTEDWTDAVAAVKIRNRRCLDDLDYIHLENDRLTAVARFAANARFAFETDQLDGDIIEFLDEYVNQVHAVRSGLGETIFASNGISHPSRFRPVDLIVVVDNLLDNARKHGATHMRMEARRVKGGRSSEVLVSDDGWGLMEDRLDPVRIFDKGYTSTPTGTGLGLYHARKVMEQMDGGLQLDPARDPGRATFIITLPRKSQ